MNIGMQNDGAVYAAPLDGNDAGATLQLRKLLEAGWHATSQVRPRGTNRAASTPLP